MHKNKLITQGGVIAGNVYDKYATKNPVAKSLMQGFINSINQLVASTQVSQISEVGCGEGHLSIALANSHPGICLSASDFSAQIVELAQENAHNAGVNIDFKTASIYDLAPEQDAAELIICCEVLEHLDYPQQALEILAQLASPYLIVSVPREPIWRILNMIRGKYLTQLGDTPGHLQHWSKASFIQMLSGYVDVVQVLTPLPWTVVLCRAPVHRPLG